MGIRTRARLVVVDGRRGVLGLLVGTKRRRPVPPGCSGPGAASQGGGALERSGTGGERDVVLAQGLRPERLEAPGHQMQKQRKHCKEESHLSGRLKHGQVTCSKRESAGCAKRNAAPNPIILLLP